MIKLRGNERRVAIFLGILLSFLALLPFSEVKQKVWSTAIRPEIGNDAFESTARMVNMMTNRSTTPSKVLTYISKELDGLSPQEMTELMYKYHAYLLAQRPEYDKKIFYQGNHKMIYKYFYYAYQPALIETIEERPFKEVMTELDASGYYLKRDKDLYHPFIDYERLQTAFSGMTDEGVKYLEIVALKDVVSTRKVPKKEIYYKNVEKLLLKCDYFINRFPLSEKAHEIQALFNEELSVYIFGNESFESYDNASGKVDQGLIDSYLRLSQNLKTENLGLLLNRYTKMVMRNDRVVVNDFLQYIYMGIQKNRSDYIVSRNDHIRVRTDLITFSGDHQYVPRIEGYRDPMDSSYINEKLLQNVYKYVYQGWYRGYQIQRWRMQTAYEITFARDDIMSLYQNIQMTYGNGQKIKYVECLNYDFARGREIAFEDLFLNYHLQKKKILESLEQGITNYEIGTFQTIEAVNLDEIDNFVITNDGIEVFLSILDDAGSKVGYLTVELSYSEFYTIIDPDFRF